MTEEIRKVVISRFSNDVSGISVVTAPITAPVKSQVQVDIIYASFGGSDNHMRRGTYMLMPSPPLTPGYCFVGRVRTNGPSTKGLYPPGTMVTALNVYDCDAERINIDEKHLVPVPDGVDLRKAVTLPNEWNTAYKMVYRVAKVQKGQRVFVHAMSGPVGLAVTIFCLREGAKVYGTASLRNHEALERMGAHPFVYTDKKWMEATKALGGMQVVFDPLGFESLDESWTVLDDKTRSQLISYGFSHDGLTGQTRSWLGSIAKTFARNLALWSNKGAVFTGIFRQASSFHPDLRKLLDMLQTGEIDPQIKRVYALEDIVEAHKVWPSEPGLGSVVIKVSEEEQG